MRNHSVHARESGLPPNHRFELFAISTNEIEGTLRMTSKCDGNADICELLETLAAQHEQRCEESGLVGTDAVLDAMAVGLVEEVWRNGPVEAMHGSKRGPNDTTMFAESTDLHVHALKALTSPDRIGGLLDFERHLLDRERVWACTGGRTLRELGYGHLGAYTTYVRGRTNLMIGLDQHRCIDTSLESFLVFCALRTGENHRGMPGWPLIVDRIGALLTDPGHPGWPDKNRGAQAIATMPESLASIDSLQSALLEDPSSLPCAVLDWLTEYLLHCAGPALPRYRSRLT